ncbi:hypothetical protein A1OE_110 [Candidatus Endolissoclinum faulkneri L2]|uniref:Uncharacterized protein n=1 Tax=Candidatus Endolissoclinum faulkneri L2 TaxID=1193729 RepID=K7ZC58_9PROT|nr:hypothetical protein A1OE_110 [Candidatus Endolissoclinum faulkneri L2]
MKIFSVMFPCVSLVNLCAKMKNSFQESIQNFCIFCNLRAIT